MKSFFTALCIVLSLVVKAQDITVPEPEYFGNVIYIKNNEAIELEKQKVHVTVKASAALMMTGLGKVKQKIVIADATSPLKITQDRGLKFIVKVTDNKYDPFEMVELFKLKKDYKSRSLLTAQAGVYSGTKAGDVVRVPYKATKYGTSSYLITITEIMMGEYGFNINLRNNEGSKDNSTYTLHLFGITNTSLKKGDKIDYTKYGISNMGTVEDIKETTLIVTTSHQGYESQVKLDLEEAEIKVLDKEDPFKVEKYKEETLAGDIKVGDTVKWKVLLIDNWSGVYLGTKDDKAVIKTTEKGRSILKEVDYGKTKLTKE
jgi:hypothetical protein